MMTKQSIVGKILLIGILLLPFLTKAQQTGIKFEDNLSWAQVKAKAKAEHKYIFMDCYTTWCGPCRDMAQNIFPLKEVGEFFNAHFISVSVQMDRTKKDPAGIRKWYRDAAMIDSTYRINVFPTFLFFSPDGIAVHRTNGLKSAIAFITDAEHSMQPDRQYYTLVSNWKAHLNDTLYLAHTLKAVEDAGDKNLSQAIGQAYQSLQKSAALTKESIKILTPLIKSTQDSAFAFFLGHIWAIDTVMQEKGYAENVLTMVIIREKLMPKLALVANNYDYSMIAGNILKEYPQIGPILENEIKSAFYVKIANEENEQLLKHDAPGLPDWKHVTQEVEKRYPGYDTILIIPALRQRYFSLRAGDEIRLAMKQYTTSDPDWQKISAEVQRLLPPYDNTIDLLFIEIGYYKSKNDWSNYDQVLGELLRHKKGLDDHHINPRQINAMIWDDVFNRSSNVQLLKACADYLRWEIDLRTSREAGIQMPGYVIDTYANLLYKTGENQLGLAWEKMAIEVTLKQKGHDWESDLHDITIAMEKMERGEKTWTEAR